MYFHFLNSKRYGTNQFHCIKKLSFLLFGSENNFIKFQKKFFSFTATGDTLQFVADDNQNGIESFTGVPLEEQQTMFDGDDTTCFTAQDFTLTLTEEIFEIKIEAGTKLLLIIEKRLNEKRNKKRDQYTQQKFEK